MHQSERHVLRRSRRLLPAHVPTLTLASGDRRPARRRVDRPVPELSPTGKAPTDDADADAEGELSPAPPFDDTDGASAAGEDRGGDDSDGEEGVGEATVDDVELSGGDGVDSSDPDPVDGSSSTGGNDAAAVGDGYRARVIVSTNGSPPDSAEGTLDELFNLTVSSSGMMGFTASVKDMVAGNLLHRGLWFGPVDAPRLVARSGESLGGRPGDRFSAATSLWIGSDDSLGYLAALERSDTDPASPVAYVIAHATSKRVVVREGDVLPGPNGPVELSFLRGAASHLATAAAFVGDGIDASSGGSSGTALWLDVDGEITMVAHGTADGERPDVPRLRAGCGVGLETAAGASYHVLPDNGVVFAARLAGTACFGSRATVRYRDGVYTAVLESGAPVPGTVSSVFVGSPRLLGVLPDGSVLVADRVRDPGDTSFEALGSHWLFPERGDPRLIALTDEEYQTPDGTEALFLADSSTVQANPSGRVILDNENVIDGHALLVGFPHPGQPYPSVANPGAAALQLVARVNRDPEPGVVPAIEFGNVGMPRIDSSGTVFYPTGSRASQIDAIRATDASGTTTTVMRAGDTVSVGDEARPIVQMWAEPTQGSTHLATIDDGSVVVVARSDGNLAGVEILHVVPDN